MQATEKEAFFLCVYLVGTVLIGLYLIPIGGRLIGNILSL